MDIDLSESEKVYTVDGIHQGLRADGRSLMDFRPVVVEFDVLPNTHGSARVRVGSTDVIAAVKLSMRQVKNTNDFSNRVNFYVTCSAVASPDFAGKQGDECAHRVSSMLRKAYRNDLVLPELEKLKLSKDRYFQTKVDILILKYDGNALDVASLAAKAALSDMKFVVPTMIALDGGKTIPQLPDKARSQIQNFDVSTAPVIVTLNTVGDTIFIDADLHEEQCVGSVVHVGIVPQKEDPLKMDTDDANDDDCYITLLKNTRPQAFHQEKFGDLLTSGVEAAKELNRAIMQRIVENRCEPAKTSSNPRVETFMR